MEKEIESHFLRTLKVVMKENGIDRVGLAKRLDICQDYIDDILIGYELPDYFTLQKLKDNFNFPIERYFE